LAQRRQEYHTGVLLTQLNRRQGGGYIIAWKSSSIEEWHIVLDRLRCMPENTREYLPDEQAWWIDSSILSQVGSWFGNFAQMLNSNPATISIRRPSSSNPSVPADVAEAFQVLCLTPDAPIDLVKAAQRVLAKQYHPDTGGSHQHMLRINLAAERAIWWINSVRDY
jgi:hypothetical protein